MSQPESLAVELRAAITAQIPSAAELDLIAVEPPSEWLADKGWGEASEPA